MAKLPGGFRGDRGGGEIEELRGGDLSGTLATADCEAVRWIVPEGHGDLISFRGRQWMPGGRIL